MIGNRIVQDYVAATPKSAARYRRAQEVFPGGVTHDTRYIRPHPLTITHARGSRKWDADGREYVDYHGGHGALILGHAHPEVMASVAEQLQRGTHPGGNHDLELRWGELVCEMVPSAERVRFTSSGTEATSLALRLARAATGRKFVVRFRGHFHGWGDHMTSGVVSNYDGSPTTGVLPALAEHILLADPCDAEGLRELFKERGSEIAGVILEPTGSTYGQVPVSRDFLRLLRDETNRAGTVLIFDEVVTGFRVSTGGAQHALGILPDLTTLGKILAGGLPGGAVAGRKDIMDLLDKDACASTGREKIGHQGTFNANPVSAAAGVATLEILKNGNSLARAHKYGAALRDGANAVFEEEGVGWVAYGTSTGCHMFTNPNSVPIDRASFEALDYSYRDLKIPRGNSIVGMLRLAMRINGVDLTPWPGAVGSVIHDDTDLDLTLAALRQSIRLLQEDGLIP